MARKDHLVTIQEEDRTSKKEIKRNNAILFQAIEPTIANAINGIGATSKTPDEVKDTKFPILNPIDPIGKNTDGTVNIDLSLENSPFTQIELSDVGATISAITINFLNLVKNKAERFILDITKDPGNASLPTVTFVPTVENLPAGFPDNDARYLLEVVARETPTETRFEVVNSPASSSTIPAGTIENQHLEWDNTATDWVAVVNSTYGATGPFSTSGFLNFANDNIMLAQRNAADSGDLEFKVTTLDEFDFTNSLDSSVVDLVIRAQQSPQANAKFVIRQNPDDGASGDITTMTAPQSILFNVNASIMVTIGPTEFDLQVNLDMNLGNIREVTEIQGRDDATLFKIVFDQAEDADTFISDNTTTADRIDVTVNATNLFAWSATEFGVTTGSTYFLQMSTNDIKLTDRLTFSATGNSGSPEFVTDGVIYRDAAGGMVFNNNVLDTFFWTLSDVTRMGLNSLVANETILFVRSDSTDFNSLPSFAIQRVQTNPVAPAIIGDIDWNANDDLNNLRLYASISATYEDVLNTQIAGSLTFDVVESVSLVQYMTMNAAKDNKIKMLRDLDMATNDISGAVIISGTTITATSILNANAVLNFGLADANQHNMVGFLTIFDRTDAMGNPAAGSVHLFMDSATGDLSVRKTGGTTVSLEGAGAAGANQQLDNLVATVRPNLDILANRTSGGTLGSATAADIFFTLYVDKVRGEQFIFRDDAVSPQSTDYYIGRVGGTLELNAPSGEEVEIGIAGSLDFQVGVGTEATVKVRSFEPFERLGLPDPEIIIYDTATGVDGADGGILRFDVESLNGNRWRAASIVAHIADASNTDHEGGLIFRIANGGSTEPLTPQVDYLSFNLNENKKVTFHQRAQMLRSVAPGILELGLELTFAEFDGMQVASLQFTGPDDVGSPTLPTIYGEIRCFADDVSNGSEDGSITVVPIVAGTPETFMQFNRQSSNQIEIFRDVESRTDKLRYNPTSGQVQAFLVAQQTGTIGDQGTIEVPSKTESGFPNEATLNTLFSSLNGAVGIVHNSVDDAVRFYFRLNNDWFHVTGTVV